VITQEPHGETAAHFTVPQDYVLRVRITGIAFEWIGSTMAFGDVVRTP